MKRISTLQKNKEKYLNNDNLYGKVGDLEIYIEKGKNIPFFTIYRKADRSVIRIKIETNEYYRWNDSIKNTLSGDELHLLNNYLKDSNCGMSHFQIIIYSWGDYNPKYIYQTKIEQPNYNTIKEPSKKK